MENFIVRVADAGLKNEANQNTKGDQGCKRENPADRQLNEMWIFPKKKDVWKLEFYPRETAHDRPPDCYLLVT